MVKVTCPNKKCEQRLVSIKTVHGVMLRQFAYCQSCEDIFKIQALHYSTHVKN